MTYAQRIRRELVLNGPRGRVARYAARALYGKGGIPCGYERYRKAAATAFGEDAP